MQTQCADPVANMEPCMNSTSNSINGPGMQNRASTQRDAGSAFAKLPPGRPFQYQREEERGLSPIAAGLGLFVLGLGITKLLAPRKVSKASGVNASDTLLRASGALNLASSVNLLNGGKPASLGLARLGCIALESTLLGRAAAGAKSSDRRRRIGISAAVIGAAAAFDLIAAVQQGSRQRMGEHRTASGALSIERCITVNKTPDECYTFWRNFDNFPRFMQHLESVQSTSATRSHWKAKAPMGSTVEWDAEVTVDQPGELLAWHSVEGADVDNAGTVRFEAAPGGRGTIVRVDMQYSPPGGMAGALIAKFFGEEPSKQVDDDLRHFKQLIETGEIPTTVGQSAGPRGPITRLIRKGVPG
jgi:uncharacterized membrane protein